MLVAVSSAHYIQAFGLVCSSSSNSVYDGRLAYVPALEDVLVWDVKKGQMVSRLLFFVRLYVMCIFSS
jgi:hypothetical protein